jgi:hypothetical protein
MRADSWRFFTGTRLSDMNWFKIDVGSSILCPSFKAEKFFWISQNFSLLPNLLGLVSTERLLMVYVALLHQRPKFVVMDILNIFDAGPASRILLAKSGRRNAELSCRQSQKE